MGDVNLDGKISLEDAVEIIMFLARLPGNMVDKQEQSRLNSLILNQSQTSGKPSLNDAVQIVMKIAKLPNKLDERLLAREES